MQKENIWIILPASGIGSRMESSIPKQYLTLNNQSVIQTTLDRLLSHQHISGAVVVLNKKDRHWDSLNYSHEKPVFTTLGSSERSGSVLNGLSKLKESVDQQNMWVMIHDAVRPCITHEDLDKLIVQFKASADGLFLAHPVADTLKKANAKNACVETVDRVDLWRAFTPQMFPFPLIEKALSQVIEDDLAVTDDVSAVQYLGLTPKIVLGRSDNIKITYPHDILIAETLLKIQNGA